MVFGDVIEVKAEEISPLERLSQEDLAPQLNIKIEDLLELERKIRLGNSDLLLKLDDGKGYICNGLKEYAGNFFELASFSGRSTNSRNDKNLDLFDLYQKVVMAKGVGYRGWLSKSAPDFMDDCKNSRRYPIFARGGGELEAHKFWGGMTTDFACQEYINSLILNFLIQRCNLPSSTYVPLKIVQFKELPLLDNERMVVCNLEDYCNSEFKFREPWLSVPSFEDAVKLSEFFYSGENIDLRVPPKTFKVEDERYYSRSILRKMGVDASLRGRAIGEFTEKLESLMNVVHGYGGTFTQLRSNGVPMSSLSCGNVSLSGIVCDLDTLNFNKPQNLSELQQRDKLLASQTIEAFSNLWS